MDMGRDDYALPYVESHESVNFPFGFVPWRIAGVECVFVPTSGETLAMNLCEWKDSKATAEYLVSSAYTML